MTLEPSAVLPESIVDRLRASIIAQLDAPGSAITESAVALRFGVARPTARIAIERLVSQGLLRREAHHAARVAELTRDDIIDLFDNRAIIESAAIGALRSIPEEALQAHQEILAGAGFAESDIRFHRALVAAQSSPRLTRMHDLLMGEIELCLGQVHASQLVSAADVAAQHQGILDAITTGDSADAAALTRAHVVNSRDALLAHIDRTTDG
jgi:DNA-binding GntR family transcriptional regulator